MIADAAPCQPATMPAAEREAHWTLWVRFAIEAGREDQALVITGQALAGLAMELPLRDGPRVQPLGLRDGIWVATIQPDLTGLEAIEPDTALTRASYVSSRFGGDVLWTTRGDEHQVKSEWPPDIWSRRPGHDDVLLHPAVRAVIIWCQAR